MHLLVAALHASMLAVTRQSQPARCPCTMLRWFITQLLAVREQVEMKIILLRMHVGRSVVGISLAYPNLRICWGGGEVCVVYSPVARAEEELGIAVVAESGADVDGCTVAVAVVMDVSSSGLRGLARGARLCVRRCRDDHSEDKSRTSGRCCGLFHCGIE